MSINKIAASLAVAGLLVATSAVNAVAETDGAFAGVQFGKGNLKTKLKKTYEAYNDDLQRILPTTESVTEPTLEAFNYAILAGYKKFLSQNLGFRAYALVQYAPYEYETSRILRLNISAFGREKKTINANANIDLLYNLPTNKEKLTSWGVFAGLSLGVAHHRTRYYDGYDVDEYSNTGVLNDIWIKNNFTNFDLGLNFGLRFNYVEHHGVEIYSRFGLFETKEKFKRSIFYGDEIKADFKQAFQAGLRYIYSF